MPRSSRDGDVDDDADDDDDNDDDNDDVAPTVVAATVVGGCTSMSVARHTRASCRGCTKTDMTAAPDTAIIARETSVSPGAMAATAYAGTMRREWPTGTMSVARRALE
jgi:hypothetical protein